MSRGIHTLPNEGKTQTWLTPPEIIKALGEFDLDPCCPPKMPWRTAKSMWHYDPNLRIHSESLDMYVRDGLEPDWFGRVWLNPPYSAKASTDWLKKLADHGRGVALVASRTETDWFFSQIWQRAHAVLFLRGRLYYHRGDGKKAKGNAGHGSVLVAYGLRDSKVLLNCEIEGQFIGLR